MKLCPRLRLDSPPPLCLGPGSHLQKTYYSCFLCFSQHSLLWCFPSSLLCVPGLRQSPLSWSALCLHEPSSSCCSPGTTSYLPSAIVSIFLCFPTTARILCSLFFSLTSRSLFPWAFPLHSPRSSPHSGEFMLFALVFSIRPFHPRAWRGHSCFWISFIVTVYGKICPSSSWRLQTASRWQGTLQFAPYTQTTSWQHSDSLMITSLTLWKAEPFPWLNWKVPCN